MKMLKIQIALLSCFLLFSTGVLANPDIDAEMSSEIFDEAELNEEEEIIDNLDIDAEMSSEISDEAELNEEEIIDNNELDIKTQEMVDIQDLNLFTETLIDTYDEFEAILINEETQETVGHLFWSQSDGKGKGRIEFEADGEKSQVPIQISDLESMEPSQRNDVLLDGLYESAGLRLARQKKEPASLTVSNDHQEEIITKTAKNDSGYAARRRGSGPVGYFDGINPQRITLPKNGKPKNRKRVAWGWAYNPENPSKSVWVHIHRHDRFVNGRSKHIGSVYANVSRPDVNRAKRIKGKHGWRFKLPERHDNDGYKDSYGFLYGRDLGVQYEAYAHFGKGRKKLLKNMRFTLCMGCSRLKD
jgi:hypothetical protein